MSTMINLVTLGASDFYKFLLAYFVELGIIIVEKLYVSLLYDWFT